MLSQLSYAPDFMVGLERLELSTSRLSGGRSNHLSYRPFFAWSFCFWLRQLRFFLGHVLLCTLPQKKLSFLAKKQKYLRKSLLLG